MKKGHEDTTVGVILVLMGIYFAGRVIGLFDFSLFFSGWWTLFIIIPGVLEIARERSKARGLFLVMLGVLLLLWRQRIISFSVIPAILIALVLILIGISIMMGNQKHEEAYRSTPNQNTVDMESTAYQSYSYQTVNKENQQKQAEQAYAEYQQKQAEQACAEYQQESDMNQEMDTKDYESMNGPAAGYQNNYETCPPNISAILVGKSVICLDGIFQGTSIQTILGNVQLDLRQAKLEHDVVIHVMMVLGGIDIYLPPDVQVIRNTSCILGDIRDVRVIQGNQVLNKPAIYITGNCILGGLELK